MTKQRNSKVFGYKNPEEQPKDDSKKEEDSNSDEKESDSSKFSGFGKPKDNS